MSSSSEDEAALARNLLHSVLALAFPDDLTTGSGDDSAAVAAQQLFLAHLPLLRRVLAQRRVFELAAGSAALTKFHARLWALLEQASDARVRAAALELQLLVLQQCALEPLEQLTPKLVERVTRVLRQQQSVAVTPALEVAAALVRHIELLSPEVRRDLYDSFAKLLPPALSQLQALGAKSELTRVDVQLWTSGVRLFVELLEASPNALRIYSGKIEQVCALLFQFPDAFTHEIGSEIGALAAGAKCLGLLANASDKTPQQWKQIVERAMEVVHLQVDLLSGKRTASSSSQQQSTLRGWIKESATAGDALLSVYQRAELTLQRFEVATAAISEMMKNRLISEREVQLVISDVIALVRRALAVRAMEIGKQTAVSDDGFRLPASVVYGILPRVQELSLRILSATVERAGICALRHASKIIKVLRLAGENGAHDSQDALYAAISVCVRSLGASTVEKLGVPLLEEMVARCRSNLSSEPSAAAQESGDSGASSSGALAEKKGGRNSSKGKKRKRQAEGAVAQLGDTADSLPFVSSHAQLVLARSVDAALASIATCVSVYGSTLPLEARSAASDLARFAVQQRARQKFLSSAAASTTSGGMDAVALLLLSDAASADSTGAHGANLVTGMRYWQEHSRHAPVLNGSSNLSTTLQLVALSAGDALLHPRAPPLSINFQDAVDAKKTAKLLQQQQQRLSGYSSSVARSSKSTTASGVRGINDWNDEANGDDEDKDSEAEGDGAKRKAVEVKKLKSDDDAAVADQQNGAEEVENENEDEDDEDYDDVRPTGTAGAQDEQEEDNDEEMAEEEVVEKSSSPVAKASAANSDDDDDDEFPDIVVDEDDE